MKRLDKWEILENLRTLIKDEGYLHQLFVDHERVESLIIDKRGKKFKLTVEEVE